MSKSARKSAHIFVRKDIKFGLKCYLAALRGIDKIIIKICRQLKYHREKEMATHFSILAWKIPWTENPGWPQSMGSQRVGHD